MRARREERHKKKTDERVDAWVATKAKARGGSHSVGPHAKTREGSPSRGHVPSRCGPVPSPPRARAVAQRVCGRTTARPYRPIPVNVTAMSGRRGRSYRLFDKYETNQRILPRHSAPGRAKDAETNEVRV